MNLVLLTHPDFLGIRSQSLFAQALAQGCRARGISVDIRQPKPRLHGLLGRGPAAKWAGYVDQYLLFVPELRRASRVDPPETLYVFCDQALGPWVPWLAHRPHVVHCHDLIALRSALGNIAEHRTSRSGRIYQRYIRWGFRHARHFVSISQRSRDDLHHFGEVAPATSEVVYNGLNHPYRRQAPDAARATLRLAGLDAPDDGMLLHVGGGQWYKNTEGVLRLYGQYVAARRHEGRDALPLWLVSPAPGPALRQVVDAMPAGAEVRFLQGLGTTTLEALYSTTRALLAPSLAEGFGWPIAEGLACGCPVLTTDDSPMNEVGGPHARYLPRLTQGSDLSAWAARSAVALCELLDLPADERDARAAAGIDWAGRFDADLAIDRYVAIYQAVLAVESRR